MIVELTTSGLRNSIFNERNINIDMTGIPVSGTEIMYAFVGMVDGDRSNFHSANFTMTSMSTQPMELVASNIGVGGEPFPAGFIIALKDPAATSGTIRLEFDNPVAVMNAAGFVFTGIDTGTSFIPHVGPVINTQRPDFLISDSTMVVPSGYLVVDLCMAQSSNHTAHLLPSGSLFTSLDASPVNMHKFSTAYMVTDSGGPVSLGREDCGGPFAGVSLTAVAISGTS